MLEKSNHLGAALSLAIYLLCILIFVFRLLGKPELGRMVGGIPLLLTSFPLAYLLLQAPRLERPVLYYIQISLMLVFLLVELLLDYVFKVAFRQVQWMVISYVTLFFGATGGMLGVAAYSSKTAFLLAIVLYFLMGILAFVQRAVTGM